MSKASYRAAKRKKANRKAPLLIIVGGVILLLLTAFFALRSKPASNYKAEVNSTPAIRVDKENVDLGTIKLGQTVQVAFDVTNVGDKPLRFTEAPYVEVKEGC